MHNSRGISVAKSVVIGLDIGTTHVRAAEVESSSGAGGRPGGTLVRYGEVALPLGAVRDGEVVEVQTVASALQQLWSEGGFSTKDVVIGVGNQRVIVREMELPWMPLHQLKASLPYQAQELLPMSTDEVLMDFYPQDEFDGPEGRTVSGMFVAAVRDTVTANILACESAGLSPQMVDLNAFALTRSLAHGGLRGRTVAFVDVGARISNIVIAEAGVPRFVRTLPAGGQDVTDAVAGAMQIALGDAERLKREIGVGHAVGADRQAAGEAIATVARTLVESIRGTFQFYASSRPGSPIEAVVLTGGGAHLPGLGQYVASVSRVPVSLGNPLEVVTVSKSMKSSASSGKESLMALSVGLALGVVAA